MGSAQSSYTIKISGGIADDASLRLKPIFASEGKVVEDGLRAIGSNLENGSPTPGAARRSRSVNVTCGIAHDGAARTSAVSKALGAKGGRATAAGLTKEQRIQRARNAGLARQAKARALRKEKK